MKKGFQIRKSVFIPLCAIYVLVTILGIVVPEAFAAVENAVVGFAAGWFGWLYQIITIVLIVICVWVLSSKKVGNIRIGGPKAKPTMSKWNWFAISLCSGIATGIVFWGIAEPITHYIDGIPGLVEGGGSRMSALYALSTCYMHWGLPLYAYYCAIGIVIGVCVYNLGKPYNVSSGLYPLIGDRINGGAGNLVDLLCVFGIAGGVSASLGVASMQLGSGMGMLAGFTPTPARLEAVDMSHLYELQSQSLLVRKADLEKYKSIEDFGAGTKVGAQTSSIQEEIALEKTPDAAHTSLQTIPALVIDLKGENIDAIVMETAVAEGYAKAQEDLAILCEVPYEANGKGVVVKKGNTDLLNFVNAVVTKVVVNGDMAKFIEEANAISDQQIGG